MLGRFPALRFCLYLFIEYIFITNYDVVMEKLWSFQSSKAIMPQLSLNAHGPFG